MQGFLKENGEQNNLVQMTTYSFVVTKEKRLHFVCVY